MERKRLTNWWIRFHRSRVNYINKVEPLGVAQTVKLQTTQTPTVYTPFNDTPAAVRTENGVCTVELPEKTAYLLLHFPHEKNG